MTPRTDVSMSSEEIAAFLAAPRTAVLSTLARDGGPHSAGMWYVAQQGALHMWTYAKSQKAVNLSRDPRAAFLAEEGTGYRELRGVLVRGRIELLTELDAITGIGLALYDRYTRPETGMPPEGPVLAEIERQASKRVGLLLPMDDIASWDHAKL
jgi:PPOX class probable F420-dependent enzyme